MSGVSIPDSFSQNPKASLLTILHRLNLAYAELYIILAGIFRKFDLDDGSGKQTGPTLALYDTLRKRDVDTARDQLISLPVEGSEGVRVQVRA